MATKEREVIHDPKYDPPYPQSFYSFWPKHAIRASIAVILLWSIPFVLAYYYQVPTDPAMPPLPDDGMNIPAPEWYLFFIFRPFWYLVGENKKWIPLFTFWLPLGVIAFLCLVPLIFKRKNAVGVQIGLGKKALLALIIWAVWAGIISSVVVSGRHAKTMGCTSCHNPMMGVRQALPPPNMADFYRHERAQQIQVGKYRIGDQDRTGASYKDANWQLRHFYEPTMTW
ncbi:MAG TPA: hypothetical protein ENI99_06195 [Sedimenticola sp.]|nr:hypothetical protein [Sedimenticola sp.]